VQLKETFHPKKVKALLIALSMSLAVMLALFSLRFVSFDKDISVMLPREPEVLRTFQFFRDSPFARNVVLSFKLEDGEASLSDLIQAVDEFTEKIKSPLISNVFTGIDSKSVDGAREFLQLAPQLVDENELRRLDGELTTSFVHEKLKDFYKTSLTPMGSWLLPFMQLDPLGFHSKAMQNLRSFSFQLPYDVEMREGHLLSRDKRHALVILETTVLITDGLLAKKLIHDIKSGLNELPPGISADIIAGHLHSLSNEQVIKRDIFVTASITSVIFLLLFLVLFKDLRALLLFVIPAISVTISIPLCAILMGKLSYIIMGMGAVISGISVDYCIHVYVAMQSDQTRKEALREIAKPVVSGALTTAGVFAVLLLSTVQGHRQLALFTIINTVISLGLALLVFPYFLSESRLSFEKRRQSVLNGIPAAFDKMVIVIWAALALLCVIAVFFVHFRMDIKQYDGSSPEIFNAEERFHEVWGGKNKPAMLVTEASSFNRALQLSHDLEPMILSVLNTQSYASLTKIWPNKEIRFQNLEGWNAYWKSGAEEKLRKHFSKSIPEFGFSENAFDPFFETLHLPLTDVEVFENNSVLQQLKRRFAFPSNGKYQLVSYFPDEKNLTDGVNAVIQDQPSAFLISAKRFEGQLSKLTSAEALRLSLLIIIILPALSFLFLKNVRLVIISLIPVVSSLLFILAMLVIFKLNLNVASIIALMVVGGFSIDYGTFMIHQIEHNLTTNIYLAVTLSAFTIFLGSASLTFAKHPILFSYGSAMVFGIVAGYLSAICVVPAFCRLSKKQI